MQRRGTGRQLQRPQSGSTPHDRAPIPQICPSRSLALDRPRQSVPRYPSAVANRRTICRARCYPPRIRQRLHRRTTRWDGSIPITELTRRAQIPIAPAAPPYVPSIAVSLYGAFFVKEFATAANRLSFVSFFVRSQSPFLCPDPRFADVVARRSCQGWPPLAACSELARPYLDSFEYDDSLVRSG